MNLLIALSLLIIGFIILIFGGEILVKGAICLASRLKVSPTIIGMTIVAFGTSTPEIITSLLASLNNTPDIAMGNIVGSNLFNMLAILGAVSIVKPNHVEKKMATLEWPILIIATVLLIGAQWDLTLQRWEGFLGLVFLVAFLIFSISKAKHHGLTEEDAPQDSLKNIYWEVAYIIIGIAMLLGGAHLALEGGVKLGQLAGLSERVIGLTIIAVGTGLPEFATSAMASFRGRDDLAVSNIIGSNIMNTLGIPGVAGSLSVIPVSAQVAHFDSFILLTASTLLLAFVFLARFRIPRWLGVVMLVGYASYIITLF